MTETGKPHPCAVCGSHTRAGAWQQAAEDLTVMCSACFGDGPGSSCEPCGGTGSIEEPADCRKCGGTGRRSAS